MTISNPNKQVCNLKEFMEMFERYGNFLDGPIYFRGESRKYDYPFMPKIWRYNYTPFKYLLEPFKQNAVLTKVEYDFIQRTQTDYKNGVIKDVFFEKICDSENFQSSDWLALAQHRGYSTRLIDITTSPLVAIYFACNDHPDEPGYVYFSDNHTKLSKENISNEFINQFDVYEVDGFFPEDTTLFTYIPEFPNSRMASQQGLFAWVRKSESPCVSGYQKIIIKPECKSSMLETLKSLGITLDSLFFQYG